VQEIHWVGGNLPQIGKAWTVRALTECLWIDREQAAVVVDTSPGSALSLVYNANLLKFYQPDRYFTGDRLVADEIFELVNTHQTLIVKLASYSQPMFLKWIEATDIFTGNIKHHFWFVTNGHRDSVKYFQEIARSSNLNLNWVRNHYGRTWDNLKIDRPKYSFNICDLPGIIANPDVIDSIESDRAILYHLAHPQNIQVSILTRMLIIRFLRQSCQSLLATYPTESESESLGCEGEPQSSETEPAKEILPISLVDPHPEIDRLPDDLFANLEEEEDDYLPY
jgi:hypothetical protein